VPGAGYFYCVRYVLGTFVFFFIVGLWVVTLGVAAFFTWLPLAIDGFLCAGRYNRALIDRTINALPTSIHPRAA
jgi:hypothetical protein